MPARTCEFCGKQYSNGASYRTHKSLYHRKQAPLEQGEQGQLSQEIGSEQKQPEMPSQRAKNEPKNEQTDTEEEKEEGWGWILAGLGLLGAIILVILKGGGGNR